MESGAPIKEAMQSWQIWGALSLHFPQLVPLNANINLDQIRLPPWLCFKGKAAAAAPTPPLHTQYDTHAF